MGENPKGPSHGFGIGHQVCLVRVSYYLHHTRHFNLHAIYKHQYGRPCISTDLIFLEFQFLLPSPNFLLNKYQEDSQADTCRRKDYRRKQGSGNNSTLLGVLGPVCSPHYLSRKEQAGNEAAKKQGIGPSAPGSHHFTHGCGTVVLQLIVNKQ